MCYISLTAIVGAILTSLHHSRQPPPEWLKEVLTRKWCTCFNKTRKETVEQQPGTSKDQNGNAGNCLRKDSLSNSQEFQPEGRNVKINNAAIIQEDTHQNADWKLLTEILQRILRNIWMFGNIAIILAALRHFLRNSKLC